MTFAGGPRSCMSVFFSMLDRYMYWLSKKKNTTVGLNFLCSKRVSNLSMYVTLTLILYCRGGPVLAHWVVRIYSVKERNILADVESRGTNSCGWGHTTSAPHDVEVGATNYLILVCEMKGVLTCSDHRLNSICTICMTRNFFLYISRWLQFSFDSNYI